MIAALIQFVTEEVTYSLADIGVSLPGIQLSGLIVISQGFFVVAILLVGLAPLEIGLYVLRILSQNRAEKIGRAHV